ncbi:replication endonuclease [Pseudoalteromonas sp. GCY]|uniref:replication endonuclease n=1 Tax=Pseudoalteromonas sp. GCY TaxID=2003316 RepID=UPI001917365D|nr:replication endonuclease [Pseudoalteromonas sp. GCY]QQQ66914.1 replication endonuclease [Pseudoalteromonas sp. GCY]
MSVTPESRSLPICWELVDTNTDNPRMQPITITRAAPHCWGMFGFDKTAEQVKERLAQIPTNRLRRIAAREYAKRFNSSSAKNPERSANIYLRKTTERVSEIIERSPLTVRELNSKKARKDKAKQLATICQQMGIVEFTHSMTEEDLEQLVFAGYIAMHDFTLSQGIKPPYQATFNAAKSTRIEDSWQRCNTHLLADRLERGIRRMQCDKWWLRKLDRLRDTTLEHLNITMGQVKKGLSPYASKDAVQEFRHSKKSQAEWVESMQLESKDGDTIDLVKVFEGSISNPEIRRIEMIVRIRGYKEWAEQQGMSCMFYTITAPSKYHANSDKYNNASPRETQEYLVKQWAKVRAELSKAKVKVFGLRIVEPHADATPHWHMVLFMKPSDEPTVTNTLRRYALQHDGGEEGAAKNRFDATPEDKSKGDAVSYIIKYISKNINGAHMDDMYDDETGQPIEPENGIVMNVAAWASRWRIRQFQFIGGAPVGLWREFRRVPKESVEKLSEIAKEIFEAADNSRFAEFIELLGGALRERECPVELAKELNGTNHYGEDKKRVVGIISDGVTYVTRATQWLLKKRDSDSPWSTGNNCNTQVHDWQVGHGDKLDPIFLIPPEHRNAVMRGATYQETDERNQTVTHYWVSGGQLMQESMSYAAQS